MKLSVKFAVVCVLCCAAFSTISFDRPEADLQIVEDLIEYCNDVANDEGTGAMAKSQFLLKCVNKEVEFEGCKPIKKLAESHV